MEVNGEIAIFLDRLLDAENVRENLSLVVRRAAGVDVAVLQTGSNGGESQRSSGSGGCTS